MRLNWDSRLLFDNEKKNWFVNQVVGEKKDKEKLKKRIKRVKEKKPNFQKLSGWFWNAGEV